MGPQRGRKIFTLQTLPPCEPEDRLSGTLGQVAGFSLQSEVATRSKVRNEGLSGHSSPLSGSTLNVGTWLMDSLSSRGSRGGFDGADE